MEIIKNFSMKMVAKTRKEITSLKNSVTDWIQGFNKKQIDQENKIKELEARLIRLEGKTVLKYFDHKPYRGFSNARRR